MRPAEIASRLRRVVTRDAPTLLAARPESVSVAPAPGKWSPKQIIGHLIDSASNNHQRFVRARFTDDLVFLGYEQESWVEVQGYTDADWTSLVTLWREFNLHVARVIERTPEDVAGKARTRHNLSQIAMAKIGSGEPVTLAWFMNDYVDHLEHHLGQVWSALKR
jgi:hypothetical protein